MNGRFAGIPEAEIDRLRELAHIGASWSANALARLADRTILTRVPIVCGPERLARRSDWETGIFCTIEGDVAGVVAIFLSATSRQAVVELLCGESSPPQEISASALSRDASWTPSLPRTASMSPWVKGSVRANWVVRFSTGVT